jgi:hypothetical protein
MTAVAASGSTYRGDSRAVFVVGPAGPRTRPAEGETESLQTHTRPFSIFSRKESRRFALGILVLNASPFVVFISAEEIVDSFIP